MTKPLQYQEATTSEETTEDAASVLDLVDEAPPSSKRRPSREVVVHVRDQIVEYLLTLNEEGMGFELASLYRQFGEAHMDEVSFRTRAFHAAREILLKKHKRVFGPRLKENGGKAGWLFLAGSERIEKRSRNFCRAGVRKIVRSRDMCVAAVVIADPHDRSRLEKQLEKYGQQRQSGIHARIDQSLQPKFPDESPAPPTTPGKLKPQVG